MLFVHPSFSEFDLLARSFNRVPLVATLMCDDLTPVSAFARVESAAKRAFLLESVVGGEHIARYSFLGADPTATISVTRERVTITDHATGRAESTTTTDPLRFLEHRLCQYHAAPLPNMPRFLGGMVGFAGYDVVRYYEPLSGAPQDDRGLPDLQFDLYESLVIFDHVRMLVHVVAHARLDGFCEARAAYEAAIEGIETLTDRLAQPRPLPPVAVALPPATHERFTSNIERRVFEDAVRRCQEYIRAGDAFQVVISQRLELATRAAPLDIYRASRVVNPSPFMFYLKSPECVLVGASPEIMCRVEDRVVTNRPLAGTRPRGATEEDDRRLREDLLGDEKERAEHVMLVDLGRNDLGRVCKPGSVLLSDLMSIEQYSHVMHLSTNVTGVLSDGMTAFDALRATLPVGTVTGAPKVRAMQIIDECEPTRRGPYAGAVGYVDFAGNMDTCIALRTLVIRPGPDGENRAYVQAGAGVVADSAPEREYEETMNKARGMLAAIQLAEERFGPSASLWAAPRAM